MVKFEEEVKSAVSWLAAQFKYMKEVRGDLEQLQKDIQTAQKEREVKDVRKALRNFRWVGRAERRFNRIEKEIEELLKVIKRKFKVSGSQEQINQLHQRIHVEASSILRETSLFEGNLKQSLIELLTLIKHDKQKEVQEKVKAIVREVSNTLEWMDALLIDLGQAKKIGEKFTFSSGQKKSSGLKNIITIYSDYVLGYDVEVPVLYQPSKKQRSPESPDRLKAILNTLSKEKLCTFISPKQHTSGYLTKLLKRVHTPNYIKKFFWISHNFTKDKNLAKEWDSLNWEIAKIGCSFTPLFTGVYERALFSVGMAVSGAEYLLGDPNKIYYVLTRPPGHHATKNTMGGFCYFNNTAAAAEILRNKGKVAILDVDCHHGNGTQDIVRSKKNVFYVSLHEDSMDYMGEVGLPSNQGFNLNIPLPYGTGDQSYLRQLEYVVQRIIHYNPDYLVISLGYDIVGGDGVGRLMLSPSGFSGIAEKILSVNKPILIIQEGGYNVRLGAECAKYFFRTLRGTFSTQDKSTKNI